MIRQASSINALTNSARTQLRGPFSHPASVAGYEHDTRSFSARGKGTSCRTLLILTLALIFRTVPQRRMNNPKTLSHPNGRLHKNILF